MEGGGEVGVMVDPFVDGGAVNFGAEGGFGDGFALTKGEDDLRLNGRSPLSPRSGRAES
jgi:hypothetical protein